MYYCTTHTCMHVHGMVLKFQAIMTEWDTKCHSGPGHYNHSLLCLVCFTISMYTVVQYCPGIKVPHSSQLGLFCYREALLFHLFICLDSHQEYKLNLLTFYTPFLTRQIVRKYIQVLVNMSAQTIYRLLLSVQLKSNTIKHLIEGLLLAQFLDNHFIQTVKGKMYGPIT